MTTYTSHQAAKLESENYYELLINTLGPNDGIDEAVDAFRHAYVSCV